MTQCRWARTDMAGNACGSCGTTNDADARFCEGCGTALERSCEACGVPASATARFCRSCGAPLDGHTGTTQSAAVRKTVTVMFADLAGSTAFEEQVDAETAREVVGRYHDLLGSVADKHRAGVTKYIGDGFMAVWGVPEMRADDAANAVDAAVELQERFVDLAAWVHDAHGVNLSLRVAVNTGEVVVGARDADLVGDALNVGARLESECPRGHVVVGEETWRSTRGRHSYEPLGQLRVKGRTSPVAVYQWRERRTDAESVTFVGRAGEFQRLQTVFDDTVDSRNARLVTVLGDPGVGKSRLATEFAARQREACVIQTRCNADGTVALAPMVEVLRTRDLDADLPADVPDRDRILRDLRGMAAGHAGSVEETFWALRRFLEVLASDTPVIIVLDDIHWADTLLLDFIEHLAEWVREVPVLIVALARPEARELRPDLVTVGGWAAEAIRLGGLEPDATAELAASVLGSDRLPDELLSRLPSSTGGNPLFVRELVGMLVHDGVLVPRPGGWQLTIDADAIAVPPTIQALLASRLERLNPADRRVLEIASVAGADFTPGAVCALGALGSQEVMKALDRVRMLELAQPIGSYIGDEPLWRFHHILIRDVAYRRLLKSDRAELHERLADWVQVGGLSSAFDPDEWVARHLESAHGYRRELGVRDGHTTELALRSARGYLASAQRALDRDELVSAGTQAARGAALAPADAGLHAELLLVGCESFLSAGDVVAAAPLVDDLERVADDALRPWATCYRCQFITYTDPTRLPDIDDRSQEAISEFARRKDAAGLAKAHRVRAGARARLGRVGDCEIDLFDALIAARRSGDHRQITAALGAAPSAALWGPSPAPKAGGRCLDVVRMQRMTTAAPSLEATSLRCLAILELLRGRADRARTMLADARQVVADLGLRHGLMETELFAGIIELMVGDPIAAEPHFRTALEGLGTLGVGADAGQAAALLARSLLAQGDINEADRYAAESERIAGHNLKTAIAWRAVRAEILSARGAHDAAVALARRAVAVAADTDLVLDHADACLVLGRVLVAAGDAPGAMVARQEAETLYAAKEAVFLAERIGKPIATPVPAPRMSSRLAVRNRAYRILQEGWQAGSLGYSQNFVYDDRRRISGEPIVGSTDFQSAAARKLEQYPHVESRAMAVRGETLLLVSMRWWDDAGNESTSLDIWEVNIDGPVEYHGRFDEDDFWDAYTELERRYYVGEGAEFAEFATVLTRSLEASYTGDLDAARQLFDPGFRYLSAPSALTPAEASLDEMFAWMRERRRQVSSLRYWYPVLHWLSPNCGLGIAEIAAVGLDGQRYEWCQLLVGESRGGLITTTREFSIEDEGVAFSYAESLVAQRPSRLAVSNRASVMAQGIMAALQSGNVDGAIEPASEHTVYDDRRRLWSGRPIADRAGAREAFAHVAEQFCHFELRTLAVRGERLGLGLYRWRDDAGNQSSGLSLGEIGDDGRAAYDGRFDEDDFDAAYRELESRYYAGEGAEFAENGRKVSSFQAAMNALDVEAARRVCLPEFTMYSPVSSLAAPERSLDVFFQWLRERAGQVSSIKNWASVLRWLSPTCFVALGDIQATGAGGPFYAWSAIYVGEFRDGLFASMRQFDDEDSAFAYAMERVAGPQSRLALNNRASQMADRLAAAIQAADFDGAMAMYSDRLAYDDHRRLRGSAIGDPGAWRIAMKSIRAQYDRLDIRTRAVRGERLTLSEFCWNDAAGIQSRGLLLTELDEDGLICGHGNFDEDDLAGAHRELESRYYAGEGTEFAENGRRMARFIEAMNHADADSARQLVSPSFRYVPAPGTLMLADISVGELFRWIEKRAQQVPSAHTLGNVFRWLSPDCVIARCETRGASGEEYLWTRIVVAEFRDGLIVTMCQFDPEDEDAAFEFAEGLIAARVNRLPVSNRCSETLRLWKRAIEGGDVETAVTMHSDQFVYDDRRRIGAGGRIVGREHWRAALKRRREDYNRIDSHIVAVRGERLVLEKTRWSDDGGNESSGIGVVEVDANGLCTYYGNFDDDDFDSAYRELEKRYYSDEGAEFAESGMQSVEYIEALNRGDFDCAFNKLSTPDLHIEIRSGSAFPDHSASQLRASLEDLATMLRSVRSWITNIYWLSPSVSVCRTVRVGIGHDGEKYSWTRLLVGSIRDGRLAQMCEFDADDHKGAFAYARELAR